MDRASSSLSLACSSSSAGVCTHPDSSSGGGRPRGCDLRLCELCHEHLARVYCASDEAQLCCGCDERIHSANFLVARHSRALLCHSCGGFMRSGASANEQLTCYTCFGGWVDSDEESKVEDKDHVGTDEEEEEEVDYDDAEEEEEEQSSSRDGRHGKCRSRGGGGRPNAERRWVAASSGDHGRYSSMQGGWGISEEGMGDSQEEESYTRACK